MCIMCSTILLYKKTCLELDACREQLVIESGDVCSISSLLRSVLASSSTNTGSSVQLSPPHSFSLHRVWPLTSKQALHTDQNTRQDPFLVFHSSVKRSFYKKSSASTSNPFCLCKVSDFVSLYHNHPHTPPCPPTPSPLTENRDFLCRCSQLGNYKSLVFFLVYLSLDFNNCSHLDLVCRNASGNENFLVCEILVLSGGQTQKLQFNKNQDMMKLRDFCPQSKQHSSDGWCLFTSSPTVEGRRVIMVLPMCVCVCLSALLVKYQEPVEIFHYKHIKSLLL